MRYFSLERLLGFFRSSLLHHSLYQTFLLVGANQLGKTSLAMEVAAFLLCQNNSHGEREAPCRQCRSCLKVFAKGHPDVILVAAEEKKSITMEQIREVIEASRIKPWEGCYKIFILEDIHRVREEGANALLKILEEPPASTIFFLTAENEHMVLPTILSRCQTFPIGQDAPNLVRELEEKHNIPADKAHVLAILGENTVDGALEVANNQWEARGKLLQTLVDYGDPITAGEELVELCGQGEEGRQKTLLFIGYLASFWRDVLVAKYLPVSEPRPHLIINLDFMAKLQELAGSCTDTQIHEFLEFLLFQAKAMVNCNVTLALLWENIFLMMSKMNPRKRSSG